MQQDINEVYQRLEKNKKEAREISKMIRDELSQMQRHQELTEEMKKLREEKKSIENEVKAGSQSEIDKLEDIKIEIATDKELIADIALNMYASNEPVEIVDDYDNKWVPYFSVTFKKEY